MLSISLGINQRGIYKRLPHVCGTESTPKETPQVFKNA